MDKIEYLKSLFYENFSISLSSGVFKELTLNNPRVSIWLKDKDIHITTKKDYNSYKYYYDNITEIYETNDFYKIVDLYRIAAFSYIYEKEEILANLISFLESEKELRLSKVDNKHSNKYNNLVNR